MLRFHDVIGIRNGAFAERTTVHAELVHQSGNLIAGLEKTFLASAIHCRQAEIEHERIFQLWTRESQMAKIIEHHASGAGINDVSQTKISHPVQEREDIRTGFLCAQHDNAVVLFGVIGQD